MTTFVCPCCNRRVTALATQVWCRNPQAHSLRTFECKPEKGAK